MLRRLDRSTVLAGVLLATFLVLTALPWRYFGRLEPTFDPNSFPFAQHHTTAWTDSGWWLTTAVLGVLAGLAVLIRTRRAPLIATVTASSALLCWAIRAWQLHHPSRSAVTPATVAIANFTAGPQLGAANTGQGMASWLAAAVLVAFIVMSLPRLANMNLPSVVTARPVVRYTGLVLLITLAVLSFLPWYRYSAFDVTTQADHVASTNAWTSSDVRDYWRVATGLGLIAAAALVLRARAATALGGVAGLAAAGGWAAGTWQFDQHAGSGRATWELKTVVITDTRTPLGSLVNPDSVEPGRTLNAYLALGVILLIVLFALLQLTISQRRPADEPAED